MDILSVSGKKEILIKQMRDCPASWVEHHVTRLDPEYFIEFDVETIRLHLVSLMELSGKKLCGVHFRKRGPRCFELTVTGFDFKGLFSILCGLLTLNGFNIDSGKIFTYRKMPPDASPSAKPVPYRQKRKKIIDTLMLDHPRPETIPENFEQLFFTELNRYLSMISEKKYMTVRYQLHKRIGNFLSQHRESFPDKMLPIHIDVDFDENFTVLHIRGADTPAFLFSLSNALTLKNISIHKVFIRTLKNEVDDRIYITDHYDRTLTDPEYLDRLKAAVVLIKQFVLYLPVASNFDMAVRQFDQFIDALISKRSDPQEILEINDTGILVSLAKLFGTGPYLCEAFTRMQYEHLLPWLKNKNELKHPKNRERFDDELNRLFEGAADFETGIRILNEYKDTELFRIDLSHLVYHERSIFDFSREITALAESVMNRTARWIERGLCGEYGTPRFGDRACRYALLALGKFGGTELGYASDIEIVVVYEGSGFTDNPENTLTNGEFFNHMVQKIRQSIHAKEAGIFEIDLALRPHGDAGPLSSSFKRWKEYFDRGGGALDYERQALVKMRPVSGHPSFCEEVMQTRDALIYSERPVDIANAMEMRTKQIHAFVKPGKRNAKFSKGALVDLEYSVQFLQLRHARRFIELRTPNTVEALEGLLERGLIRPSEFEKLFNSYVFLRRLINALRMVRGNARDLDIPDFDSDEFQFLAKRLGYVQKESASAETLLHRDIEYTFRTVRRYYESRFEEKSESPCLEGGLPEWLLGDATEPGYEEIQNRLSVRDSKKAFQSLRRAVARATDRKTLIAVLVLAERYIQKSPDPDQAVIHFEKFIHAVARPKEILKNLLTHPRYIELLFLTFGFSEYLSNLLFIEPELIFTVASEDELLLHKSTAYFSRELSRLCGGENDLDASLAAVRKYRNREMLRIGIRDIYLNLPFERIVREISDLSETIVNCVYHLVLDFEQRNDITKEQAVIAMGKFGGRELNYSSDIDILFVLGPGVDGTARQQEFDRLNRILIRRLSDATSNGRLFRVDTTLRPYGNQGALSGSFSYYLDYYQNRADGWELQAWLKARPIAGDRKNGRKLVKRIQRWIVAPDRKRDIRKSLRKVWNRKTEQLKTEGILDRDVKSGRGGIRTVEFFVQDMQVRLGAEFPEILAPNTLKSIERILRLGLISSEIAKRLRESYIFLRKIEHRVQLFCLQQRHLLPESDRELESLSKRMGYEDRLEESAREQFTAELALHRGFLKRIQDEFLHEID